MQLPQVTVPTLAVEVNLGFCGTTPAERFVDPAGYVARRRARRASGSLENPRRKHPRGLLSHAPTDPVCCRRL